MKIESLNSKIKKLTPKFEVNDVAPSTFEELKRSTTSKLVVWSGNSDRTIYGDFKVNYAFRAWHDALHLKLNAPLTLEGETLVALEQARLLRSDVLGDIMMAEVVSQGEFFIKNGHFPIDQVEFIKNVLKGVLK